MFCMIYRDEFPLLRARVKARIVALSTTSKSRKMPLMAVYVQVDKW